MRWVERILLAAWLGFCFGILTVGTVWGGDCTDPGDCRGVPDNASRTAAVAGGLAGGLLAWRSYNKGQREKDPCRPIRREVESLSVQLNTLLNERDISRNEARGQISDLNARRDQIDRQISALQTKIKPVEDRIADLEQEVSAVETTIKTQPHDDEAGAGAKLGLIARKARLKAEIEKLEAQIAGDKQQVQDLAEERNGIEEQMSELQEAFKDAVADFDRQEADLRGLLKDAKQRLRKCEKAHASADQTAAA